MDEEQHPLVDRARPQAMQMLDAASRRKYDDLPNEDGRLLQIAISESAGRVVQTGRSALANELPLQRLKGFLMLDERVLSLEDMPFATVVIDRFDKNKAIFERTATFPAGTLLLTDRRVVLLASRFTEGLSLQPTSGLNLVYDGEDSFWYHPVPLSDIKSVTVNATTRVKSSIDFPNTGCTCCGCPWSSKWEQTDLSVLRTRTLCRCCKLKPSCTEQY